MKRNRLDAVFDGNEKPRQSDFDLHLRVEHDLEVARTSQPPSQPRPLAQATQAVGQRIAVPAEQ